MSLADVDWSLIPEPADDGKAAHLEGMDVADLSLPVTDGGTVNLRSLPGLTVVYIYPMTGRPDKDLPDGWDDIPGARGCTPQSCAFRDHAAELRELGADHLFGMSTQTTAYQAEAAARLNLPFGLLSDAQGAFSDVMDLPDMVVHGERLLKRLTMIIKDGVIAKVFYPVFPPDQDAANVMAWLTTAQKG
ncbi:peroxiredoxin [Yoonia sediminilitoris]|uniref:Peroxiredoxin n=1 Tax=Yoonia sediminilitoris TaxID=1286148 RepID=A0A2T6KQ50_9RHOB|nr:peroxiredoxin [Yoonia sediminilitoris]PUB18686.1 peroxiredoxin [Yoonia sediminilitoris]RCW98854.1 peroxiredoxin [Yoonia sediminilitoris]